MREESSSKLIDWRTVPGALELLRGLSENDGEAHSIGLIPSTSSTSSQQHAWIQSSPSMLSSPPYLASAGVLDVAANAQRASRAAADDFFWGDGEAH